MGELFGVEDHIFHLVTRFLSYEDSRPVGCVCKSFKKAMEVMRAEWSLWPLTPGVSWGVGFGIRLSNVL